MINQGSLQEVWTLKKNEQINNRAEHLCLQNSARIAGGFRQTVTTSSNISASFDLPKLEVKLVEESFLFFMLHADSASSFLDNGMVMNTNAYSVLSHRFQIEG